MTRRPYPRMPRRAVKNFTLLTMEDDSLARSLDQFNGVLVAQVTRARKGYMMTHGCVLLTFAKHNIVYHLPKLTHSLITHHPLLYLHVLRRLQWWR